MAHKLGQGVRCAIYTRKSTEHGLELEFNSLDAQREACEAYIKSQASEGWQALPKRYDDPAYSGGTLERPAVQRLLTDIEAGLIDVVVVYKIDRLTRSLADFAKLVEVFDAKSISFVAVTQQFNTTTSMGRLTLNVLLSFAQFERELASERVRDKVAASRKKGKWTGGSVPLGYDSKDKKLVINPVEAKTVRMIFTRYLALKSFQRLIDELNSNGVVSKKRVVGGKIVGGVPFTYGPLSYLLKNRTYLGETGHNDHWYAGEHEAIIETSLFNSVRELLKTNAITRRQQRSNNHSLLTGFLFDDRGNPMRPSFSTKHSVRYRFYISSALLARRRAQAGSVTRVSAPDLEKSIVSTLRERFARSVDLSDHDLVRAEVQRIVLAETKILITVCSNGRTEEVIELPRLQSPAQARARVETEAPSSAPQPDLSLLHPLVRAHSWLKALADGTYDSIEELALFTKLHPKVVRKALRMAFLAPDIVEAIITGSQLSLLNASGLQAVAVLSWNEQRRLLKSTNAA